VFVILRRVSRSGWLNRRCLVFSGCGRAIRLSGNGMTLVVSTTSGCMLVSVFVMTDIPCDSLSLLGQDRHDQAGIE
jgi:hypothetical protein